MAEKSPRNPQQQAQQSSATAQAVGGRPGMGKPLGVTPENQVGRDFQPAELAPYLAGVEYPAARSDLMDCAIANRAPREMIGALENLPDQAYQSTQDVVEKVGRLA